MERSSYSDGGFVDCILMLLFKIVNNIVVWERYGNHSKIALGVPNRSKFISIQ